MATIKDKRSRSGTTMFDPIVLASSTATWAINKLLDRLSNALIKALLKQEDLDKEVGDLKNALQRANLLLGAVPVGVSAGVKIENKNLEEPINKVQQLATELTKYLDELEYYDIKDKEPWMGFLTSPMVCCLSWTEKPDPYFDGAGSIETPVRRRGKLQRPLMKHTCLHPLLNIERLQLPLKNISAAAITPGSKRSTAQKSPATARIESGSSQPGK
ncbi:hypothetical protein U9M48_002312, partial [Paspalum notatum var. saurae]